MGVCRRAPSVHASPVDGNSVNACTTFCDRCERFFGGVNRSNTNGASWCHSLFFLLEYSMLRCVSLVICLCCLIGAATLAKESSSVDDISPLSSSSSSSSLSSSSARTSPITSSIRGTRHPSNITEPRSKNDETIPVADRGRKKKISRACQPPNHHSYPFCNVSLPLSERVDDLIGRLTLEEKPYLLTARQSPTNSIPRLGVPECTYF